MLRFVLFWKYFVAVVFIVFTLKLFDEIYYSPNGFFQKSFSDCQTNLLIRIYLHLHYVFEMSILEVYFKLINHQH